MNYLKYLINTIKQKKIQIIILAFLTLLAYYNIFQNGFVWDDKEVVVDWQAKQTWQSIPNFLLGETPPGHPGNYRPVRNILYILDYKLWGLSPAGYHLQSILIQLAATLLVYLITTKISKSNLIPFFTAIFFGLHPIHTEAVTWITSSMDVFGIVFLFLSVYLYLLGRERAKSGLFLYSASILMALLAVFTNEITLIVPFLILLINYCFPVVKKGYSKKIVVSIPYFLVVFFNAFVRLEVAHQGSRGIYIFDSFTIQMLLNFKAMLAYYATLIWPIHLTINHALGQGITSWVVEIEKANIPVKKAVLALSPANGDIALSILITLTLITLAFYLRKKIPAVTFAIGWFFISLITVSNLVPTEAIMVERFTYLASYGFCLALSFLLVRIFKLDVGDSINTTRGKLGWGLIMTISLFYLILTINRNANWKNNETLWKSTLKVNPQSILVTLYLSEEYLSQNRFDLALGEYEKALKIDPYYPGVELTAASVYGSMGRVDDEIIHLNRAIALDPLNYNIYFMLGNAYKDKGQYQAAITAYQRGLRINPYDQFMYNNLGVIYSILGIKKEATSAYKKALQIDPNYESAKINLEKLFNER